jgi:hypothetical protein
VKVDLCVGVSHLCNSHAAPNGAHYLVCSGYKHVAPTALVVPDQSANLKPYA